MLTRLLVSRLTHSSFDFFLKKEIKVKVVPVKHTRMKQFAYRQVHVSVSGVGLDAGPSVLTALPCVPQHAQAPEEAGLQRPALRQEEGLAGSQRDQ